VLSNPSARRAYDRELESEAARANAELGQALDQRAKPPRYLHDAVVPMQGFPGAVGD
jgi:hypothetical protein